MNLNTLLMKVPHPIGSPFLIKKIFYTTAFLNLKTHKKILWRANNLRHQLFKNNILFYATLYHILAILIIYSCIMI